MTFFEYCRNRMFWIIDALRGGLVKDALEFLKRVEEGQMNDKEIEDYQKKQAEFLLQHAINTVPRCEKMESLCLQDWPITNKDSYRSDYNKSISSSYEKENLIKMTTSGSTGTPFTSYQDALKKRHVNAEVLYYNGQIGYEIGRKIIYLRSVVSEVAKSKLSQFAQNIILIDCMDLSDKGIEKHLETIRKHTRFGGAMLMGYASTLDAFRKYFKKYGYDKARGCNIYGVISGSELLQDITRESMEKAFGCKCLSRYANEENGFLGQDGVKNNVFFMNRAHYITEVLKFDSDNPVDDGVIGRIVITDLYNYAMPMIRYDTGDVGAWIWLEKDGKIRKAIGSFGGRKIDMVTDINGNIISPHSITNMMWKYQNVIQYQFIQKGNGQYVLRLNVNDGFKDEQSLKDDYLKLFGGSADLTVEYTKEIPVLSSGKRKYIVNEMNNK